MEERRVQKADPGLLHAARDLKDGVAVAAQSIDSRAARGKLDALVALSRRLAEET